jgi:hypothetical protein
MELVLERTSIQDFFIPVVLFNFLTSFCGVIFAFFRYYRKTVSDGLRRLSIVCIVMLAIGLLWSVYVGLSHPGLDLVELVVICTPQLGGLTLWLYVLSGRPIAFPLLWSDDPPK